MSSGLKMMKSNSSSTGGLFTVNNNNHEIGTFDNTNAYGFFSSWFNFAQQHLTDRQKKEIIDTFEISKEKQKLNDFQNHRSFAISSKFEDPRN